MTQEVPIIIPDPHSLVATGVLEGLAPKTKFQQYQSVEFLSNFHNVNQPCTHEKTTLVYIDMRFHL